MYIREALFVYIREAVFILERLSKTSSKVVNFDALVAGGAHFVIRGLWVAMRIWFRCYVFAYVLMYVRTYAHRYIHT